MQAVLRDLWLWFLRLVPANPILVRVVFSGGRRVRHLWMRVGYLSILAVAVVVGVVFVQSQSGTSLADLAKSATKVFEYVSIIQLGMVCLLAPLLTAAAITQEKDAQTYNILLSTPLTNGQIVLGSLLSRLYFVFVLLIAGIPLFCIMMVYGGVTGDKIVLSSTLAACTAALTGSLAIAVSMVKVGTGRTIFSFYLAIAVYLIVIYSLATWPGVIPPEAQPAPGQSERMSWLAAFHPFLALWVVLGKTPAPAFGAVAHYGFPSRTLLAYPQYSYIVLTLLASVSLVFFSLFFVRRSAKEGEMTLFTRLFGYSQSTGPGGERTRNPRHVWQNPIAWREAGTGASATGGAGVRYTILGLGLIVGLVILVYYGQGALTTAAARVWLYGVVAVELGITLFIATATAATSMTREKESNTLELLLATPVTSKAILWGKIRGLVTFAAPMLLVPYLTVLLFLLFDLISGRMFKAPGPVVHWEALITLPALLIAFTGFACMLGLQYSIKSKKTLSAVFMSMGIVVAVFAVTAGCAYSTVTTSAETLAAVAMPFSPVTAVHMVIDPAQAVGGLGGSPTGGTTLETCRIIGFIAALCSAVAYCLVGFGMHRSMVRNFDMIIRKQTA